MDDTSHVVFEYEASGLAHVWETPAILQLPCFGPRAKLIRACIIDASHMATVVALPNDAVPTWSTRHLPVRVQASKLTYLLWKIVQGCGAN